MCSVAQFAISRKNVTVQVLYAMHGEAWGAAAVCWEQGSCSHGSVLGGLVESCSRSRWCNDSRPCSEGKVTQLRCRSGPAAVAGRGGGRLLPGHQWGRCGVALGAQWRRCHVCAQVQLRAGLQKAEGWRCTGCNGLLRCWGCCWLGVGSACWMWLCVTQGVLKCSTAITIRNLIMFYRSKFSLLHLTHALH